MAMTICVYAPYEGWRISFTGTKGRLEAEEFRTGVDAANPYEIIRVIHQDNTVEEYKIAKNEVQLKNDTGIANYTLLGHNGGDSVLRRMLFVGDLPDTLHQIGWYQDASQFGLLVQAQLGPFRTAKKQEPRCFNTR